MIRMMKQFCRIWLVILLAGMLSVPTAASGQVRDGAVRALALDISGSVTDGMRGEVAGSIHAGDAGGDAQSREEEQSEREQEKRDREQELRDREQEKKERALEKRDREQELYDNALEAVDEARWEKAAAKFDQVAKGGGPRADAALYWKAYAFNRLGRRDDSLATLGELGRTYPQSRWLKDAKALEVEVRQSTGQPVRPESETDEDLKIIAINGLQHTDPERAVPLLEKVLQGSGSPKLKQRALFVLAQTGSPQARETMARIARQSNPDLQRKAVEYLGLFGGKESRHVLADIYAGSSDVDVKRAILRSFMVTGDRERLLAAARGEKVVELRREAIRQLGVLGAQPELWQLYQNESSVEIKEQILQAMFVSGNAEKLIELARTEKVAELRRKAIRNLGLLGSQRAGEALVALYGSEKDLEVRREVLNSLFLQGNVKALIEVARKESDPGLKKTAVQKLSLMNTKEATDFLMEILNK